MKLHLKPRHSKHEQTVHRAIRDGWYIEEIQQLVGRIEATTIHRIAKRHGMKARHAPKRPDFMRLKEITRTVNDCGVDVAASLFRIHPDMVRVHCRRFAELDRQRQPESKE